MCILVNRNNKLTSLPEGVPGKTHEHLILLQISSNRLTSLPMSLSECISLKAIYANGNKIETISEHLFDKMNCLSTCNLSNNQIESLPDDFIERFGQPDVTSGLCNKVSER